MHIKPAVGSVVGPTSTKHWAQVLQLPMAYGVVEMEYADGGARAAGIHLLSVLSKKLTDGPVSLSALSRIAKSAVTEGVRTILLAVPVGHIFYIVLIGAGDVYLKRGKEFAHLLAGPGEISGEGKAGDTLLFTSAEFSKAIKKEELTEIFDSLPPREVAERLTLLLHEKTYREGSAALILQIKDISPGDAPPPVESARVPFLFHPKKKAALITGVLLLVFGVSVLLGVVKQASRTKNHAAVSALADARHALDEGIALIPLNPVKGREKMTAAKDLLEPLRRTVAARSREGVEIAALYRQVMDNLTQALQVHTVVPNEFFDAGLVKKDGKISSVGFEKTVMAVADWATKTVYTLDIVSKKTHVVAGGQTYTGLSYVGIHGSSLYALTDKGIYEISLTDKKNQPPVILKDLGWGTISSLVSFGGNIYLLDITHSRIWKYIAAEKGFSQIQEYLNADTLPDLSRATSMAIDGSVWVGTADGKIMKFTQGRTDTFVPKGIDPPLGDNVAVYTNDTLKNLYILDSQKNRVVVLDKDGTYLSQYVWDDKIVPSQLAVSEDQKNIYLVTPDRLYAFTMK